MREVVFHDALAMVFLVVLSQWQGSRHHRCAVLHQYPWSPWVPLAGHLPLEITPKDPLGTPEDPLGVP